MTTSDGSQLSLRFCRSHHERTELTERSVAYPWSLTQPFHLKDGPSGMATVIPQSLSGGLFRGDILSQSIAIEAGAAVHLASQGATLVHARRGGEGAISKWSLQVDEGGWLEVLNDPLVLGSDAAMRQCWSIQIAPTGTCLLIDAWTWLGPDGAPLFDCFENRVEIRRPEGNLLALERSVVGSGEIERLQTAFASPIQGFVSGLLLCPMIDSSLTARLGQQLDEIKNCWAGVSMLPGEVGIVVRAACISAVAMTPVSDTIWNVFRQWRLGCEPTPRRRNL